MDRRAFLVLGGATLAAGTAFAAATKPGGAVSAHAGLRDTIAQLEKDSGGRLGVAVHDLGSGFRFAWRGDERFAMCSSFKILLAGAVMARVEMGSERLDRRVPVAKSDIIGHAPFTTTRVGGTASVAELCHAMTVDSDNGAANLMLAAIGGPAALTRFLRGIGDPATRLDRTEPELNTALVGDPRDTTTPIAMIDTIERLVLGGALTPPHRRMLRDWMVECRTGLTRLRAGLPKGWVAGDKTGTSDGDAGTYNDVAIVWPPQRKPVLVSCYLTRSTLPDDAANAIHAKVARAVVAEL